MTWTHKGTAFRTGKAAGKITGRPERIDRCSYKRQGIDKIPTVHMGVVATQMERRGIQTEKGNVNRQIIADNKLLKEIRARITRLYNWSKEEAAKSRTGQPTMSQLWAVQQEMSNPTSRIGKLKKLQAQAALFNLLNGNGITTCSSFMRKL